MTSKSLILTTKKNKLFFILSCTDVSLIIYFLDKKNDLLTVLLQVTRKKFLQVIFLHVVSCESSCLQKAQLQVFSLRDSLCFAIARVYFLAPVVLKVGSWAWCE
jgi:hypothetical protein